MGISQHPIYSVCSRTKYLFSFGSHCPCPLCCSVSIHREHPPCCCSHSLLIRSRLLWLQFQAPQHSPYSQTPTGKQGFYVWVAKPWVNSSWSVLSVILKCGPSISIAWELVEKANPQLHSNLQNLKFWGGGCPAIGVSSSLSGDSDSCWSVRTTGFGHKTELLSWSFLLYKAFYKFFSF